TNAVRDTEINGVKITKDDFMGIIDGDIVLSKDDRKEATIETLKQMLNDDSEIVTIILGDGVPQEEAEEIASVIEADYSDVEVEIHEGKQPVYPYFLSVE